MGDFAAQAVVNVMLGKAFPGDAIVGEEDAADLRGEEATSLRTRVVELANEALVGELGLGDMAEWGIGPGQELPAESLLEAIDRGTHAGGRTGRKYPRSTLGVPHDDRATLYRLLDPGPYRRNERFPPRRAVCRVPVAHRGLSSPVGCNRMPELTPGRIFARGSSGVLVRRRARPRGTTSEQPLFAHISSRP